MKLPTEEEILKNWNSDYESPVISFLCISYNQDIYIEDTIKGFLSQRTPYPFEIVIHDDKSIDNTQNVISHYQSRYPRIIKTIFQAENQYSQGRSPLLIGANMCNSKYIAICEGDDYWTNPNKTMNQLQVMLDDTSITMVVSQGKAEQNGKVLDQVVGYHGNKLKKISAQYILDNSGSLAPTASYLVKKSYLIEALETFKDAPVGDLFIELYNAVYGKLIYYPEVVCVYRKMAKNSWSVNMASSLHNAIKHSEAMKKTIDESKKLDGFRKLDWTKSRSTNLFNLAINHLYHKDIEGFKKYIMLSNSIKKLEGKKLLIFNVREHKIILYLLIYIRKYIVSIYK